MHLIRLKSSQFVQSGAEMHHNRLKRSQVVKSSAEMHLDRLSKANASRHHSLQFLKDALEA